MTHIRRWDHSGHTGFVAFCTNAYAPSSISLTHWRLRLQSPAIAGQIERIPGGVCRVCQVLASEEE